jgi:hypothetical protein
MVPYNKKNKCSVGNAICILVKHKTGRIWSLVCIFCVMQTLKPGDAVPATLFQNIQDKNTNVTTIQEEILTLLLNQKTSYSSG